MLIAVFACFVVLFGIFTITRGAYPDGAELAFIEYSATQLGSVLPASCESDPNIANGDGNYTGCSTEVCWNGTTVTPIAGESCPARPTEVCWNGTTITPSLGESCPARPTEVCWNGTTITPSLGESCPARPTVLCWNGTTITPSLGESCPPDLPPVADAGPDVTQDVSIDVALPSSGAIGYDPDGSPVTVSWLNTSRPGGSSALNSFGNSAQTIPSGTSLPVAAFWSLDTVGTYTFELVVTDAGGQTVTDSMNVNVIPTAASSSQSNLTVTKNGTGDGTVTSNPGGINCGGTCSATYSNGTVVNLNAVAIAGSAFAGWSGGGCSGSGACSVSMTSSQNVTATFNVGAGPLCSNPPCGGVPGGGSGLFLCLGVPSNAIVNSGDDTGLSQSFVAIHRLNTSRKCEFSCRSGFIWNGTSCNDALASGGALGAPTLTVSPAVVPEGSETLLTWNLHGQTGCVLTGGLLSLLLPTDIGTVRVTVAANTTYTISCASGGSASATAEIIPVGFET